jgi:hypothetical protein
MGRNNKGRVQPSRKSSLGKRTRIGDGRGRGGGYSTLMGTGKGSETGVVMERGGGSAAEIMVIEMGFQKQQQQEQQQEKMGSRKRGRSSPSRMSSLGIRIGDGKGTKGGTTTLIGTVKGSETGLVMARGGGSAAEIVVDKMGERTGRSSEMRNRAAPGGVSAALAGKGGMNGLSNASSRMGTAAAGRGPRHLQCRTP